MRAPHANLETNLKTLRHRLERDKSAPLYRQIVQQMTQWIEQGDWLSGQPLPTIKGLTFALDVSEMTVRRALADLSEAGLIEARRGSGTYVSGGSSLTGEKSAKPMPSTERRLRIGVVFASLSDGYPFVERMLRPLESDESSNTGPVRLQIMHLHPDETDPNAIRHQLPLDDLDGVMLMSPVNVALLWLCQRRGLPYVLLFNDIADGASTCVVCDYHAGMHEAMAHVTATGCRRPALVTAGDVRFSTGQISDAFMFAARQHGLTIDEDDIVAADYTQQHGYEATLRLLQRSERPDAIFYSADHQACGGLLAAQEMGVAVPDELAIIGAGNVIGPMQWPQRPSTIDLSLAKMTHAAMTVLCEQIHTGRPVQRRLVIPSRFVAGQTTINNTGAA